MSAIEFDPPNMRKILQLDRTIFFLLAIVVAVSMSIGLINWLGVPLWLIRLILDASVLLLTCLALCLFENRTVALSLLIPLFLVTVIGALGAWTLEQDLLVAILYARKILAISILFAAGYLIGISSSAARSALIITLTFFLAQPVFGAGKLLFYGIDEKVWIGTLHQTAGQLGLLFALVAMAVIVPIGIFQRRWVLLFLPVAICFAIINEKRAILVAGPTMLFIMLFICTFAYLLHSRKNGFFEKALTIDRKSIFFICFCAMIAIPSAIIAIPSLNSMDRNWGGLESLSSISRLLNEFVFAFIYTHDYLFRDFNHQMNSSEFDVDQNLNIQIGRLQIMIDTIKIAWDAPIANRIFGFGGMIIDPTYLLGSDRSDLMFEKFGIRGQLPFALMTLVEAGFFGLLLLVSWFGLVGALLLRRLLQAVDTTGMVFTIIGIGLFGTLAFDVFLYSDALWRSGALGPVVFLFLGAVLSDQTSLVRSQ
ncbi:hypothetical protein ABWH92_01240 [Ahrensia marina]|uniref:hypothetical protein n=1 Tax=Ahrensia marina TaxID=1514904 RepID=UPI0035CF7279